MQEIVCNDMALSSIAEQVKHHVCEQFQLEEEKVEAMLPTFFTTLQEHVHELEEGLQANDPAAIGRVGHMLKGALLNLGLDDMAEIAHSLEMEGKAGRSDVDFSGLVWELKEKMGGIL